MKDALKFISNVKLIYNKTDQNLLQLNSMENFLFHFDKLNKNQQVGEIKELIEGYIEKIKKNDFIINREFSNELAFMYTVKIGKYYRQYLGFRFFDSTPIIPIFQGLIIDTLLYFLNIFNIRIFFPFCAILMCLNWLVLKVFYVPKKKVYGTRY